MSGISVNEQCVAIFNQIKTRSAVGVEAAPTQNGIIAGRRGATLIGRYCGLGARNACHVSVLTCFGPFADRTVPPLPRLPVQYKWVTYKVNDAGNEVGHRRSGAEAGQHVGTRVSRLQLHSTGFPCVNP